MKNKFVTEIKPCSECKYYKNKLHDIDICTKKLMGVTPDMHVYYNIEKGTCFETLKEEDFKMHHLGIWEK